MSAACWHCVAPATTTVDGRRMCAACAAVWMIPDHDQPNEQPNTSQGARND